MFAVDGSKIFNGLDFDNDARVDEQVSAKALFENDPIIFEADDFLPFDLEPTFLQLPREYDFIDGLQQPRSQIDVDFQSCIHDPPGDSV